MATPLSHWIACALIASQAPAARPSPPATVAVVPPVVPVVRPMTAAAPASVPGRPSSGNNRSDYTSLPALGNPALVDELGRADRTAAARDPQGSRQAGTGTTIDRSRGSFAERPLGSTANLARPSVWPSAQSPVLRANGKYFTDASGRVVILRGVSLAGDSKVPPFLPCRDVSDLDRLPALGINVIRLLFVWEAYEPEPARYDAAYLGQILAVAEAAWARGMYVIIDFHQDGFSRCLSRGFGSGLPRWAVSSRVRPATPDNGPKGKYWQFYVATDYRVHRSFSDFYADRTGVRSRYLRMVGQVAAAFASIPGVIGYDLLNEPWGRERSEIAPLYRDAATAIRASHPSAILFVEGHVSTSGGMQTKLPRPTFDNFAYAPHFYKPATILQNGWRGFTASIDRAFATMATKAEEWDAPLFLGEFGVGADAHRAAEYVSYLYDRLDDGLTSGTQWNYTPGWNERDKDRWNGEDFNVVDPKGRTRSNYSPRPYPRTIAGVPLRYEYHVPGSTHSHTSLIFTWQNRPEGGSTEIFVPGHRFPGGSALTVEGADVACWRDEARQLLVCSSPRAGTITVRLTTR
jgi:endoglycosylceramidase